MNLIAIARRMETILALPPRSIALTLVDGGETVEIETPTGYPHLGPAEYVWARRLATNEIDGGAK